MEWYVFAVLGALFTGFAALTHKKGIKTSHSLDFSATLSILNLVISIPFLFIIDYAQFSTKALFIIFFGSFFATGGFFFITKAISHMEISEVTPFLTFGPVIVAFFAFIFLGEKLKLIQIIGILLIVLGALFLEAKKEVKFTQIFKDLKYLKYVFISLLIYGLGSLIDRVLLDRGGEYALDSLAYLSVIHIFIAINFIMLTFILSDGFHSLKKALKSSGPWIVTLAILTFSYRFFQSKAVEEAPAIAFVSVIKRTSILISVFIGGKLFHEGNIHRKIIASMIMIAGNVLIIFF